MRNVKKKDNLCFLYSTLAIKHRADREKNPQRVKQYEQYLDELIYDEADFPLKIPRKRFFEQKNNIVYGCEDYNILSRDHKESDEVNKFRNCKKLKLMSKN